MTPYSPIPADIEADSNQSAPVLRDLTAFRLHRLARLSIRHANSTTVRQLGVKRVEIRVLVLIHLWGPLSFKAVCDAAELTKSYASRIVSKLIGQGLVQKVENPHDQRSILLSLTGTGRQLHWAIFNSATERQDRWLSVLSDDQRAQFATCLDLLTDKLVEMIGADGEGSGESGSVLADSPADESEL